MMGVVTSMPALGASSETSIWVSWISGTKTSFPALQKHYILGAVANEGSIPNKPSPRQGLLRPIRLGFFVKTYRSQER